MTRQFLSRDEWPLVASGIMAGVLTAAVVLYFFVTGIGGTDPRAERVVTGEAPGAEQQTGRPDAPVDAAARDATGPVIGARERGILARLDAMPVSARPLTGPLSITARDLVWNERSGRRFLRADAVTGSLDTRAAQRGDILLNGVVIRGPVMALREEPRGWNWEQVFEELLEGDPRAGPRRTVQVRDVRIVNGDVEVVRPAQRFAFREVDARLPLVVFSQPNLAAPFLRAASASARFVQADPEADLQVELANGLFQFPDGTVRFDVATASLDGTRFADLDGVWVPGQPGYGVTGTGRALAVDFADVAFLTPEGFPETGSATFTFAVAPAEPNDTRVTLTELEAVSGESRVLGSFTARIGIERFVLIDSDLRLEPLQLGLVQDFLGRPLPYGGALRGTVSGAAGDIRFDLTAALTAPTVAEPFTAGLSGRLAIADDELTLRQLDVDLERVPLAALRTVAPALPVGGAVTGRVSLTGLPGETPLNLDVRLELGAGVALVAGTLDLTGAVPRYELNGRVLGVDLQSVLQPAVPPVALTARFTLVGSGFDPAIMDANLRLAGRFTGWRAEPDDTVHVVAALRGGTVSVDTLHASLATAAIAAAGDWRFLEPQSGALTYDVAVTSLAPFGPYLPVVGDSAAAGSITAEGSVTGTLQRMRLAGAAGGTEVQVGAWRAGTLNAEYDLVLTGGMPEAQVEATATNLGTPTAGAYERAELSLQMAPPALAFDLNAVREDGGLVEVLASGDMPEPGHWNITVERARFDLAEDRWLLVSPTTITWTTEGLVDIDALLIESENTEGRVYLAGRILPRGRVDALFELAAFPMGDVQRLAGLPPRIEGELWADGTIRGGTEDPLVTIDFRVLDGSIDEIELQRTEGRIAYVANETRIRAQVVVDTAGTLDMEVMLPSRLSLDDELGFELLDALPLSGSVTARRFALAPFAALDPRVRDLTGFIDAQVTLAGSADAPRVSGTFTLNEGAVTVVDLNQRYTQITGAATFQDRRIIIDELRARSDGWAEASGQIVLERLDQPVVDVEVRLDQFRPMGVDDQRDAAFYGRISLAGGLDGLRLTGALRVEDGYLVIPQLGGSAVAAELADITRPASMRSAIDEGDAEPDLFTALRIDNLRMTVGEGVWFDADQARAQLSGELVVNKSGGSLPITGTLQGTRGQYTLVAGPIVRRFDIVSAQVRFRGLPEPNPLIDITARRIVVDPGARQLDVDVRITGTLENPQLALAGGSGAGVIAESELLSILLFGQPGLTGGDLLTTQQGGVLEQTFFGGFAELAALELERSLGGLGLDIFQIRLASGPFGGIGAPTFVLGRQLREDVFLTVETGINALFGAEGAGLNTWAVRLDWTFDDRSRLRLALEPVYRGRLLRGSALLLPLNPPAQQLLVELRRRWTY